MESDGTSIEFRHFDSVPIARDHYFINSKTSNNGKNANIIMKEWRILEQNLPDSIYVQVYETRIDLLRAVIIGSAGTPYHDCLFFFDIFLPSDYPNQPPHVYYHSHGYRLNPNLYANGRLCLSLINTWSGKRQEKWTNGSTILQLLVSIQGLVLNSRPYFNEPGIKMGQGSKLSVWIKASNRYSEDAFTLSCMTLQKLVQHPPQNFESFVLEHCRKRAASLMEAIDNYQDGIVQVGELGMTPSSPSSPTVRVSSRFKTSMERVRGHLELAFAPYVVIPKKVRVITPAANNSTSKTKKQHNKGIFNRFTGFVKKMWTSKK